MDELSKLIIMSSALRPYMEPLAFVSRTVVSWPRPGGSDGATVLSILSTEFGALTRRKCLSSDYGAFSYVANFVSS